MVDRYTDGEICMLYREAKNKKLQIEILTQLTGLREFEIKRILEEGGYSLTENKEIPKGKIKKQERIIELHAKGFAQREIAHDLGVAQSTVNRYIKILGLEPNKKGAKKVEKEVVEKLKEETQQNVEELRDILPKSIPDPDDLPINYVPATAETLTPLQYYELAKLTLELIKLIWEG